MLLREFGKASFAHIQDGTSRLQIYVQKQVLGEEAFGRLKKLIDLGDIIGVEGTLFRTKTNELTLAVRQFTLLTKSLQTLPEKYHGLTDIETALSPALPGPDGQPRGAPGLRGPGPDHRPHAAVLRQTGAIWRWRPP